MSHDPTSLRTIESRVRFLGAARSGTSHAWAMRVTAAALTVLTVLFVWLTISLVGRDYGSVHKLFGHRIGPGAVALLFLLTGAYHMKLGMQAIIEDYIHDKRLKELALLGNIFFCALIAAATGLAIVKLSIGG